jgi:hypothetical protein
LDGSFRENIVTEFSQFLYQSGGVYFLQKTMTELTMDLKAAPMMACVRSP